MNRVSAYELAHAMTHVTVSDEDLTKATDLIEELTRSERPRSEDPYLTGISAAFDIVREQGDSPALFNLNRAAGFLIAASRVDQLDRTPEADDCAYQVLSMSRLIARENEDIIDQRLGSPSLAQIPTSLQGHLANEIYDGRLVTDEELVALMPDANGIAAVRASKKDVDDADRLLVSIERGDELAEQDAEIAKAVRLIGGNEMVDSMRPALGRVFAAIEAGRALSAGDAAKQLAADLLIQKQAAMIVEPGDIPDEGRLLKQAFERGGGLASELVAQASGNFEGISRGGQIELAKDLCKGDALPESRKMSIDKMLSPIGIDPNAMRMAQERASEGASVG